MFPWCHPIGVHAIDRSKFVTAQCAPGKSEQVVFDEALPGFGLRVRATGAKTWLVHMPSPDGRSVSSSARRLWSTLARRALWPRICWRAFGWAATQAPRRWPRGPKRPIRSAPYLPRFLAHQRGRLKPRSHQETTRHLERHARPLHGHPILAVDRRMLATLLAEIAKRSGPAASNRVRASLSAFLSWAAREGYIEANAVAFTNKRPRSARVSGSCLTRNLQRSGARPVTVSTARSSSC